MYGTGDPLILLHRGLGHSEMMTEVIRHFSATRQVIGQVEQINASAAESMKDTPMYQSYVAVAPRPEDFPRLLDKMGDLMRQDYDWSAEIARITAPTMLVYGDHDAIPPWHMAEFFALLGGGQKDAGWDGAGMAGARSAMRKSGGLAV